MSNGFDPGWTAVGTIVGTLVAGGGFFEWVRRRLEAVEKRGRDDVRQTAALLESRAVGLETEIERVDKAREASIDTVRVELDRRATQHEQRTWQEIGRLGGAVDALKNDMARRADLDRVEGKIDKLVDRFVRTN